MRPLAHVPVLWQRPKSLPDWQLGAWQQTSPAKEQKQGKQRPAAAVEPRQSAREAKHASARWSACHWSIATRSWVHSHWQLSKERRIGQQQHIIERGVSNRIHSDIPLWDYRLAVSHSPCGLGPPLWHSVSLPPSLTCRSECVEAGARRLWHTLSVGAARDRRRRGGLRLADGDDEDQQQRGEPGQRARRRSDSTRGAHRDRSIDREASQLKCGGVGGARVLVMSACPCSQWPSQPRKKPHARLTRGRTHRTRERQTDG